MLFYSLSFTQDVIVKNNKEQIAAKVIEIDDVTVKYRLWTERQEGPLYSIKKTDIFLIIYQNGRRETFNAGPTNTAAGLPHDAVKPSSSNDSVSRSSIPGFNEANYDPPEEKLDVLNGITKMNVQFDYSSLLVNDMPESEFIKNQVEKKGLKNGNKWLTSWRSDRANSSEPFFVTSFAGTLFNRHKLEIKLDNTASQQYTLIFKVLKIYTEKHGRTGIEAVVSGFGYIVETAHSENIIAKLGSTITAEETGELTGGYSLNARLAKCYSTIANKFWDRLKDQFEKRGIKSGR